MAKGGKPAAFPGGVKTEPTHEHVPQSRGSTLVKTEPMNEHARVPQSRGHSHSRHFMLPFQTNPPPEEELGTGRGSPPGAPALPFRSLFHYRKILERVFFPPQTPIPTRACGWLPAGHEGTSRARAPPLPARGRLHKAARGPPPALERARSPGNGPGSRGRPGLCPGARRGWDGAGERAAGGPGRAPTARPGPPACTRVHCPAAPGTHQPPPGMHPAPAGMHRPPHLARDLRRRHGPFAASRRAVPAPGPGPATAAAGGAGPARPPAALGGGQEGVTPRQGIPRHSTQPGLGYIRGPHLGGAQPWASLGGRGRNGGRADFVPVMIIAGMGGVQVRWEGYDVGGGRHKEKLGDLWMRGPVEGPCSPTTPGSCRCAGLRGWGCPGCPALPGCWKTRTMQVRTSHSGASRLSLVFIRNQVILGVEPTDHPQPLGQIGICVSFATAYTYI